MPGAEASSGIVGEYVTKLELDAAQQAQRGPITTNEQQTETASEMPLSHPEVSEENITSEGLLKACDYFKAMAAKDPEQAQAKAEAVVQRRSEQRAMREKGMSEPEIKTHQWSSARDRRRQKATAAKEGADTHTEPVHLGEVKQSIITDVVPAQIAPEVTAVPVDRPETAAVIPDQQVQPRFELAASEVQRAHRDQREAEIQEVLQLETVMRLEEPMTSPLSHDVIAALPIITEKQVTQRSATPVAESSSSAQEDAALAEVFQNDYVEVDDAESAAAVLEVETGPMLTLPEVEGSGVPDTELSRTLRLMMNHHEVDATLYRPEAIETLTPEMVVNVWETELMKEPAELYDDFVVALEAFGTLLVVDSVDERFSEESEASSSLKIAEDKPLPEVVMAIARDLAELAGEDREQAALVLRDIVGAAHGIKVMELRGAEPEAIALVHAQLEELCAHLFEVLPKEYDEAMVRQFIAVFNDPEFTFGQTHEVTGYRECISTREVKRRFGQLASGLNRVEDTLHRAIGGSALMAA